jgi:D-psicose/D-tagatose/L-ribulose 3-epimerase
MMSGRVLRDGRLFERWEISMRTGMNMLLWTSHVGAEHFPVIRKLARCGFDGVEVPLFEGDEAHYRAVGRQIREAGMGCSTITVCTPDANPISADAGSRARAVDRLKWALDMTAAVGGDVLCGPYYCPLGEFTGRGASEDEKKRAADVLRAGAEHAKGHGVRIAVEFLCRFETYFLNTAKDAVDLVRRVDHPALGMMYDTFHANIEERDPQGALAGARGHLIHFHVSENDRGVPGAGHVPWVETFRTLRGMGYDGWLTIEAFGRLIPEVAAATRVWRDFFDSPDDVYERGLAFVRRMWEEAGE